MNKKFLVILLIMLCEIAVAVFCASANEIDTPKPKPSAEYHFNKKVFWTGTGILAAAKLTDAITSERAFNEGYHETDPIYGKHPSSVGFSAENLVFFAGQVGAFYLTEHSHNKAIRWIGRASIVGFSAGHAYSAQHNTMLKSLTLRFLPVN